jgi:hypothetical protein
MKTIKHILTTVFVLSSILVIAQSEATQKLVVPLSNPGDKGSLEVSLVNGSINVTGYSGKEVIIEASELKEDDLINIGETWITPSTERSRDLARTYSNLAWTLNSGENHEKEDNINRSTEGMKKIGSTSFHLTAEEKDNKVVVESDSWQQGINLAIKVPSNFDLQLNTINRGGITVENVTGMLELENVNGSISATNVSGAALISTVNGGIKVDFKQINNDSPMSFTTLNGDVEVVLPSSTKATMKMKTDMGEIYTDFDMNVKQQEAKVDKQGSQGKYKVELTKWIIGEVNGGGAQFTFQSMSGDFYIRKK